LQNERETCDPFVETEQPPALTAAADALCALLTDRKVISTALVGSTSRAELRHRIDALSPHQLAR